MSCRRLHCEAIGNQTQFQFADPVNGIGEPAVVEDDDGNTYRAVYTVKFAGVVYVLHAFQKKSKSGVKTPAEEIAKVKTRLKQAEKHHAEWARKQKEEEQGRH